MIALLLLACILPDDYDPNAVDDTGPAVVDTGEPADTEDTDAPSDGVLVGSWVSEGANLSDLFQSEQANTKKVEATFRANETYVVKVTSKSGEVTELSGTYATNEAKTPHGITLEQTEPYVATAEGIWEISGANLTYEVVQTNPDYGFTPPSGSFGTTSGPGLSPGVNVQTYVRR